jgi:hypothetical protein
MKRTNRIYTAAIRSTVDFVKYTGKLVDKMVRSGFVTGTREEMIADSIDRFKSMYAIDNEHLLSIESISQTLFTPKQDFNSYITTQEAVSNLEQQLAQRHSKSATSYADEYIFHIIPQNYEQPKPRATDAKKKVQTAKQKRR